MASTIKVVVIGGGVAGLAATSRLLESGIRCHITLLEARERLGGRVHTKQIGSSYIELGAQWIHGEDGNKIHDLAVRSKIVPGKSSLITRLMVSLSDSDEWFLTDTGDRISKKLAKRVFIHMDNLDEEASKYARDGKKASNASAVPYESVGEYIHSKTDAFLTKLKTDSERRQASALIQWTSKLLCADCACSTMREVSLAGWGVYQECAGEPIVTVPGGYQRILDVLQTDITHITTAHASTDGENGAGGGDAEKAYRDCMVKLATSVKCVKWSSAHSVVVETTSGDAYEADHVIVTLPLGVLKHSVTEQENEEDSENRVEFVPSLPPFMVDSIRRLGFGTVNKIYVEFDRPVREIFGSNTTNEGFQLVWMNEERWKYKKEKVHEWWHKEVLGFDLLDYQPNMLEGWISGVAAEHIETLPEEEVLSRCASLLEQFVSPHCAVASDWRPVRVHRTQWLADPHSRGSYSSLAVGSTRQDIHSVGTPLHQHPGAGAPTLLFAGEHTHPIYFSTVHGAYESGLREAERIISAAHSRT